MMRAKVSLLFLFLVTMAVFAGIRGGGQYAGTVVFDRWDGCTLYSGMYVMYISEEVKEQLRPYAQKPVLINATDVFQPMNPGDGLIKAFEYLGPAPDKQEDGVTLKGITLNNRIACIKGQKPAVEMQIINKGSGPVDVHSSHLALTLLTKQTKTTRAPLTPADGPSVAWVTRQSFWLGDEARWQGGIWTIGEENALPRILKLAPGESWSITVLFDLPRGEYDFLSGYGGGVHAGKCLTGNRVGFDVDLNGHVSEGGMEPINKKNIRNVLAELSDVKPGIVTNMRRILDKPPQEQPGIMMEISEEMESRLFWSQPQSGEALLSVINQPNDSLHQKAVQTLLYLWPFLPMEQKEAYYKTSMTASVSCRPEYPQGIEAYVGTWYDMRYNWKGWPGVEGLKMKTVSQKYLDGQAYGDPFHYEGPQASAGGILVSDLSPGQHTAKIVTEYTVTDGELSFSGRVESDTAAFKIVGRDIRDELAAPRTPELTALVERVFQFHQFRDPNDPDSHLGGIPLPDHPWAPANSAWRRGSYDRYAIYVPIYTLAEPLPVDLCFKSEYHIQETGRVYPGESVVVKKGLRGEFWCPLPKHTERIDFVRDNPGFLTVKIVLTPAPELAFSDKQIRQYYNGTLESPPLQVKNYWFRYDEAKPWEKELIRMYEELEKDRLIHEQVNYSIRAMASLDPFTRLSGIRGIESNHRSELDVSSAIPFLIKIQEGNETDLEKKASFEAAELLKKL